MRVCGGDYKRFINLVFLRGLYKAGMSVCMCMCVGGGGGDYKRFINLLSLLGLYKAGTCVCVCVGGL